MHLILLEKVNYKKALSKGKPQCRKEKSVYFKGALLCKTNNIVELYRFSWWSVTKLTRFSLVRRVISCFRLASIRASSGRWRLWVNSFCCCSFSSFNLFTSSSSFLLFSLWTRSCSCIWHSRSLENIAVGFNSTGHYHYVYSNAQYYFFTCLSLSSLHKQATALHLHSMYGCLRIWRGTSENED